MQITINDKATDVPAGASLQYVLELAEINTKGIATAVNGTVIPRDKRNAHIIGENDKIIIIKAFYGG